ncbi:MAG: arsenosugar biosynthesis radical SAM protein ArsS [bacterium]|nr:arsenosugar biosynthesis radical SAM protein ArsS [bacterium]
MNRFEKLVSGTKEKGLYASGIETLQVNVGLICNQSCAHCHLGASRDNHEIMQWSTMQKVLCLVREVKPALVDITGGAPELNPHLRRFVAALAGEGCRIQVRTNLTALAEKEGDELLAFFGKHRVLLAGSLPCYLEENVTAQRGKGVYGKSVETVKRLNKLGYGIDEGLQLNLVYNPGGAYLPGDQAGLEADYKRELKERFGIRFNNLLTIVNMPVGRFRNILEEKGNYDKYMNLLTASFNAATVQGLMCRSQISIRWDGALYDCDFNLALNLVMNHGAPDHIDKWVFDAVAGRRIVTGTHCFGCTAGAGSSCGGAIADS